MFARMLRISRRFCASMRFQSSRTHAGIRGSNRSSCLLMWVSWATHTWTSCRIRGWIDQTAQQPDEMAQAFWRGATAGPEALRGNNASGMVGPGRWNLCARAVGQAHDPVRLPALTSGIDYFESSFPKRMNPVCDTNLRRRITKSIRSVGCSADIPAHPKHTRASSIWPLRYSGRFQPQGCYFIGHRPPLQPCREHQSGSQSPFGKVIDVHAATVQRRHFFSEIEAEPCALLTSLGAFQREELLEYAGAGELGDTGPFVVDAELNSRAVFFAGHGDASIPRTEIDRVLHQIRHGKVQQQRVAGNRDSLGNVAVDAQSFFREGRCCAVENGANDSRQRDWHPRTQLMPAFQFGQLQHAVDEPLNAVSLALDV